ncbi:MAG TPA: hypothetical protein VFZ75_02590 [Actinomycetota bacterium]|nr:hypothetical protein [Actinomycetota bacterium]
MTDCVTCGAGLHPERAEKYDYCTKPACRARNARPRTIATVGVNKAADQFVVLDDRTAGEMESGRYRDAGRTSAGRLGHRRSKAASGRSDPVRRPSTSDHGVDGETWTKDEQNLALAFEITGRLPLEEIARRLGRDQRIVAEMLVAAKAGWSAAGGRRGRPHAAVDRDRPD